MKDNLKSHYPWLKLFSPARLVRTMMILAVLCMGLPVFAQNITVSGNVVDQTGEPVIGASVLLEGTSIGMATDFDGNFTLSNVPSNGKLQVSYIGYKTQTVAINGRTNIDVTLQEDSEVLDEVVVVGYGTVKKNDLTGSVSSVNTEQLNTKGAPSVLENLQGLTPGVSITKSSSRTNGGFDVEIRGKSSINSSTTPIYVVDGVMCSDIDFLNPQDIERIDVLKDASSTAIYGSRATAGVVMITTKGGLNVKKDNKASITYDGYYGFNKVARMPEFMDAQQYYNYRTLKFSSPEVISAAPEAWVDGRGIYAFQRQAGGFGQAWIQKGQYDPTSEYVMKTMLANGESYDWPGMVTQNGHQQNHYLAVSGSSETANYHFGVGYNEEEGIYAGDKKEMYSFKGSVDARINKVISAGFNVNAAQIKNSYADDGGISNAYRVNTFMRPYDAEGNINRYPGSDAAYETDGNNFTKFNSPLLALQNSNQRRETWRFLGNVYLQLDIIKGLNIKTTFSPTYTQYRNGYFSGYVNPDTGMTYADADPETSQSQFEYNRSFGWVWDNTINFNRTFGDHDISALGLVSMESTNSENSFIAATGVMENTDWWNIGNSGTVLQDPSDKNKRTRTSYGESRMQSYALRGNYTFKGRYMLTATIRWDGSSKFAHDYRWGSFPSVALAWRLSEEEFLRKEWLSNLKLRLSYGVTGNNKGIGNYATVVGVGGPIYYPFGGSYNEVGYYPSGIVDEMLSWEKSKEWNVGLDFGFLSNRIMGSVDWYTKKSTDLLYSVDLPLEAGGASMTTNVGSVRNTGVEVSLTTVNFTNRDWEWTTTFNFSHNDNEVLEINGVSDAIYKSNSSTGHLIVGQPYNMAWGYQSGGIVSDRYMTVPDHKVAIDNGFTPGDQVTEAEYYKTCYGVGEGQPIAVDINGDGQFNEDDRVIYNSNPKWIGSISSNLTYRLPKNGGMLDFNFSIYTKQGFKVASPFMLADYWDYHDRGRGKVAMDYYIPDGVLVDADGMDDRGAYINPVYQNGTHYGDYPYPNAGANDGLGSQKDTWDGKYGWKQFVDGSYWKVKNISLGYTFHKNIIKKIGCQNLRVYFTVTNPFVWTKYKGFDPEWATASTKTDGPSIVSYQLGASIKF
ncbi:MAG: TonB-dependent receptor [Lachnoclostridium sp.]|nr:TonB-dependent receptor [Lachnoclostridium sp.]